MGVTLSGTTLAQVAAPSTLPGQNAPVQIQDTPPVAVPMPVYKPKSGTPAYPPAYPPTNTGMDGAMGTRPDFLEARKPESKAKQLREAENGAPGAANISAPVSPQQRPAFTPNAGAASLPVGARAQTAKRAAALTTSVTRINGQPTQDSPNGDSAKLNAALAARFQNPELDDTDRAALGIDAKALSALKATPVTLRESMAGAGATQRVMGAPGSGSGFIAADSIKAQSVHKINSDLWCKTYLNNEARIARIVPARDNQLAPDQLFVVKGSCFGDQPGTLEIRFNTSPAQVHKARVINWAPTMVHAQLPENITGVTPQNVDVVLITRDNRIAPKRSMAFTPRWEKVFIDQYARNVGCFSDPSYPHTRAYCKGARNTVPTASKPFDMDYHDTYWRNARLYGIHYTEEDLAIQPVVGTDRWTFDLPPYARIAGWGVAEYYSPNPAKYGITVRAVPDRPELEVRWHMADMGEEGSFAYFLYRIEAWLPVGVMKQ